MDEERLLRYKEKLKYLEKTIGNLKNWIYDIEKKTFNTESALQKRYSIYHAFQIIVEIISDIAAMIIKDEKILPKDDYTNIDSLIEKNIINTELGTNLKEANGLRNRIVHDYNGLDDLIAYERILVLINNFKYYIEEVNGWLVKNS
ncbi:MAG: DUF86 domain-containing protein [Candidatus Lokiarchaeota archaeon]|nr:DUF86 domain-containing protein [Candidatus Lokiarchaeota archaeon]